MRLMSKESYSGRWRNILQVNNLTTTCIHRAHYECLFVLLPSRPCSDMCIDIFSNCFDKILLLGDLWPEQMGCSNFPSASACFKPRLHDNLLESGSDMETGVVETTSLSNGLTQVFDQEISTSVTSDDSRLIVTNSTTHERITTNVINISQGVMSDSGTSERTQSVTESSKSISTERNVVTDELSEQGLTTVNQDVKNIINASDKEDSATTVETNRQEEATTTALLGSAATPTCEVITVESCSKYYNWTILPNSFGHETQLQAEESLARLFVSIDDLNSRYCAGYLESIVCASLLPPCGTGEMVLRYTYLV